MKKLQTQFNRDRRKHNLPEYLNDVTCVELLHKKKSSFYVRSKGYGDGEKRNCNPPTKEGYYYDEYMCQYRLAILDLPF